VYGKRREKVFQLLDALRCDYSKQQAGLFVWARIAAGFKDCYDCSDQVLNRFLVFITPGGIFGKEGEKYIRVSLCATEEKITEARQRIIYN
jgi:aspartate/methionine/tyrosine aminotransferase